MSIVKARSCVKALERRTVWRGPVAKIYLEHFDPYFGKSLLVVIPAAHDDGHLLLQKLTLL